MPAKTTLLLYTKNRLFCKIFRT